MNDIASLFDQAAESYDSTRRKYISCIDDFYGTAIEQIPFHQKDVFSILDLGAGTGLLSAMVIKVFPNAQFTLADISSEMLEKAKSRFKDKKEIEYKVVDFEECEFQRTYDVIISALALHHSPSELLRKIVKRIYASLKPGGVFINADQILGETQSIETRYEDAWLYHAKKSGCSQEEIAIAIERMKADRTSTLSDQLQFLKDAGFEEVNCWYQFYRYATYSGMKPQIKNSNKTVGDNS